MEFTESAIKEAVQRVLQEMQSRSGGPAGTVAATQAPTPQARVPGSSVQRDHIDPTQGCSSWFNNSTLTNTPPTNDSENSRWQRFGARYQNAIESIRNINPNRRESIAAEQRHNFGKRRRSGSSAPLRGTQPKRPRLQTWTHQFVCLPKTKHNRVPSTIAERNEIIQAGLWEKKLTIPDIDCGAKEFNGIILEAFPKLHQGGGFELLKCIQSSRNLEIIPYQISCSPRLLKQSIGSAKIYIRPIQADLDLSPLSDDEVEEVIIEKCLKCGEGIPITQLQEHTGRCTINSHSQENGNAEYKPVILDIDSEVESDAVNGLPPGSFCQQLYYYPQCAGQNSGKLHDASPLAKYIQQLMETVGDDEFYLRVRRSHVLEDALIGASRRMFSPYKTLIVKFVGEEAVDEGGPRREFWRVLGEEIRKTMCAGDNEKLCLEHDVVGLQENKFKKVGILMAMSLAQQGSGFPFFGNSTFSYLCSQDISNIDVAVDEVPDHETRTLIMQLMETNDSEMIKEIVSKNSSIIMDCGYSRLLGKIGSEERQELIRTIFLHGTIYKVMGELEQLKAGLNELGVADQMKANPKMFETYFTFGKHQEITAEIIQELFEPVKFSEDNLESQTEAFMHFIHLLAECEDDPSNIDLRLSDVLAFFSGADKILPMGFSQKPTLEFSPTNPYPMASTCTLTLTLPTKFKSNYNDFRNSAIMAFKYNGGFGLV